MKIYVATLSGYLLAICSLFAQNKPLSPAPKRPVTDTYFGKAVIDNYRWLEDLNNQEVKDWFKTQGDYTNAVLDQIPGRDSLINTFVKYDALMSAQYSGVRRKGNRYFYRKTLPTENVGKIYVRDGKTGTEQLLFDPTTFVKGKTYSVSAYTPSPDGNKIVIGLQEGGGEYSTLRTLDVATKAFGPESITAVFGGNIDWLPDGSGFLYTPDNSADPKDPKAAIDTKARLHRLSSDPQTDPILFSRTKNPDLGIRPEQFPAMYFSDDHTQLYGRLESVDRRLTVWLASPAEVKKPAITWKKLTTPSDSVTAFVKVGSKLYLQSIKGASKGQILVTDADNPNPANATILLAQGQKNITRIVASKDYLFVTLSDGINETIRLYDTRTNTWNDIPLPFTGTAGVEPYDPAHNNDVQVYVMSWNNPVMIYDYTPEDRKLVSSVFYVPVQYPGVADLVVEEVEIPGHDGILVPLSIIYRKGLKRDGSAACLMSGYGAYGMSGTPYFSRRNLALLNKGVVLAETHPRGGSEKGQAWYQAGFKTTKPNTWKDFIASGDYLIKKGYTSPGKLIGMGTSAGGVLIGRAITERPDLFAAAISNVSCSNALRMENSLNGPLNIPEFGTVKDSTECMALYEMDALHHVKEGTKYPAVLCVGGMNDPRVVAWQPGKFAAALQNATSSGKPVLMQVNYDNGHFTEDKKVTFRNFANMYAFALWQAGHPDFQQANAQLNKVTVKK
ncbi:prolyl oligopeptidase family serine peptidase [Spirosoma validum]|uniref:prolyl oligopeptidase n=1 Tax=Spirosoma validum TaxID=2771355 RepID=A0A927AYZ4_9BACT|nr:prolyl oligopeptidase family serine peptidase [Spirosoma validum]MBD2752341.1 S9 family peptidase [Spirosoma validum]